jgi:PPOX class probable F420-dependent enzyme
MKIDTSTPFGARVQARLRDEAHIWLTTVRADGIPEPNPVGFLWDGSTFLIYSHNASHKNAHIRRNPRVALNFNTSPQGDDVVVFTGDATINDSRSHASLDPTYLAKYRSEIQSIGMTPESFFQTYSVIIRVTPTRLRGF